MAQGHQAHVQCPSCGGSDIAADSRYGNKLKGREFMRRSLRSPIIWIGLLLAAISGRLSSTPGGLTNELLLSIGLFVVSIGLIWIAAAPIRRTIYDASNAARYPDVKYTCRLCGHTWTSGISQTAVAPDMPEIEDVARTPSQETESGFAQETPSQETTHVASVKDYHPGVMVLSFIVGMVGSWLAGLAVQGVMAGNFVTITTFEGGMYSVLCFPVETLIIVMGAIIGARQGRRQGVPYKGATWGIWIGIVVAVILGACGGGFIGDADWSDL